MTTISTAGMIAAVREAAHMTKTQEERDVLNGIANRVEMLAEANSIKSLELDSIRQALKIPGSDSVQAGTIAAFCKLQSDLQEVTALANRLRRTAKEYHEENQQLRTQLIEAEKVAADPSIPGMWILDEDGHPFGLPVASQLSNELLQAMEEVIRISDRDHEAWDRAKAAISSCRAVSAGNRDSHADQISPETRNSDKDVRGLRAELFIQHYPEQSERKDDDTE
ncbi:hypothetical protein [Symbiopectobacterium purcellii]|uniref:hypothetical protein n=1 Tax=Symbiopectobacterium purcellii TaxID=2871826 RepID=UPI003F83D125